MPLARGRPRGHDTSEGGAGEASGETWMFDMAAVPACKLATDAYQSTVYRPPQASSGSSDPGARGALYSWSGLLAVLRGRCRVAA